MLASALVSLHIGSAGAAPAQDRMVRTYPSASTPHAVDGRVYAFAQVGNKIIAGGRFTAIKQTKDSATIAQKNLFAFDATTGVIDTGFRPVVDGDVNALEAGPDGASVYIGGKFNTVNGVQSKKLARLSTTTGAAVAGFTVPFISGPVNDFDLVSNRLLVGGQFAKVGVAAHAGLASLNPVTGAVLPYMNVQVAGHHNFVGNPGQLSALVGVWRFDVSNDGRKLAAVGNFKTVNGLDRDQLVLLDLGATGATVANWQTDFYKHPCSSAIDFYVRDVSIAPTGAYFVVATYGGPNGPPCDLAARFETNAVGSGQQTTWRAHTMGDSLWSVAVTGAAVYVGGHFRWFNNPLGSHDAQPGAVPRPGVAALDPINGLPLSWNPGRNPRGAGTYELFVTTTGLWMGSDTDYVGNRQQYRGKLAFFPLAGGLPVSPTTTATLPGRVYQGGKLACPTCAPSNDISYRTYDGTTAGATNTPVADAGFSWSTVRGGLLINGTLFYGSSNGNFYKRSFDGTTFGAAVLVDPYNDPFWSNIKTGSPGGQTYRGKVPGFYGTTAANVNGMFYSNGRIYYARPDTGLMYSRYFTPDTGVIGAQEFQGTDFRSWTDAAGMFLSGSTLYYGSRSTGNLFRVAFVNGQASGTAVAVSGPAIDGKDWRATAMFLR